MRELRRLLLTLQTADPEPSSCVPVHRPLLCQVTSSVNERHSVQAVAVQTPASHDEWLADARSRQQHPRWQRERRAQKMQSDEFNVHVVATVPISSS